MGRLINPVHARGCLRASQDHGMPTCGDACVVLFGGRRLGDAVLRGLFAGRCPEVSGSLTGTTGMLKQGASTNATAPLWCECICVSLLTNGYGMRHVLPQIRQVVRKHLRVCTYSKKKCLPCVTLCFITSPVPRCAWLADAGWPPGVCWGRRSPALPAPGAQRPSWQHQWHVQQGGTNCSPLLSVKSRCVYGGARRLRARQVGLCWQRRWGCTDTLRRVC